MKIIPLSNFLRTSIMFKGPGVMVVHPLMIKSLNNLIETDAYDEIEREALIEKYHSLMRKLDLIQKIGLRRLKSIESPLFKELNQWCIDLYHEIDAICKVLNNEAI